MEQWEKDYLEAVAARKRSEGGPGWDKKQQKKYMNQCWEEVIQPDGSKLYVPKKERIRRREERERRRSVGLAAGSRALKGIVIAFCLIAIFLGAFVVVRSGRFSIYSLDYYLDSLKSQNTYVNGVGLINMVNALSDILNTQVKTLNAYTSGDDAFSDDELQAWADSINENLFFIEQLRYDESYTEYVEAHVSMLTVLSDYVTLVQSGDFVLSPSLLNEFSDLLSGIPSLLITALDENGVEYEVNSDGTLIISYLKY